PFFQRHGMVESVGNFLEKVSSPFNPYIKWEMNPEKCPINSYEYFFMAMAVSTIIYIIVSKLTCKEPFNLERMLHRGKYATEGEKNIKTPWTLKTIWSKMVGITPEYSKADKIITWSVFSYSFFYGFCLMFLGVIIWNSFHKWPDNWWANFFYFKFLLIPGIAAFVTSIWFTIGGIHDILCMFRDLKARVANPLDNGMVEGHVALDEKQQFDELEAKQKEANDEKKD
ncbi:MAG: hypothetical protein J5833_04690, partial [Victivallales bacterium]|nr:hypothetical protein [Victivallales bacterium]